MEEITEVGEIGTKGLDGLYFPFILMLIPEELNQLFQVGFFNLIRQRIVQPRPERPSFQPQNIPSIHVPPHVSLQPEVPANNGWKEIVNLIVSRHHGWPNFSLPPPPHVNSNVHISHLDSPIQSSHASKKA